MKHPFKVQAGPAGAKHQVRTYPSLVVASSISYSHSSSQIHVMKYLVHIHMPHWHPFVCFGCQLQPTGRQKLKKKGQKVNTTTLQHAM